MPAPPVDDATGLIKDLVHRAGLRADVLTDGTIRVGDELVELS